MDWWMGTLIRDELSTTARPDPWMKRGAQSPSPPPHLLPSFLSFFWWTSQPGLISCLLHMLIGCLSSARHRGRRDLSDSPPPLPSRRQVLPFLAELGNRHSSSNVVGGGRGAHSPPPPPPLHKRPSSALRSPRHSTVPDIVITRRRNSAYETVERDNGPPNGRDVCERRNSGGGLRRLDNWIQHLMHEGVSKKDQRANEWKYADDVKVTIAPIAHAEVDEQPRYSRDTTRASTVLQNLREQADHIELNEKRRQQINNHNQPIGLIQSQPSPLPEHPDMNRSLQIPRATPTPQSGRLSAEPQSSKRDWEHDMNVIFLQANDEVKRVVLPPRIDAMEQIKMAFVRVFPHITRGYIEQPFVKIYIQDPVKGLFYELDDLREVRHKTVLRLREQRANGVASPVRHLDHPDYHSEAEVDDANRHRFVSLARPASAMARARDPYYDSYSSDASDSRANSVTRSGSATPIIDKEARDRMETMERQLAGLSSLVHTALVSKGMPESAQRDMADLRRQILALHPDPDRLPNESPAPASELSTSPSNRRDLVTLRERIHATGTDCRQLRSTAQANAQEAQNMLQEASLEITRMISQQIAGSTHPVIRRSQTPQIQAKDDFEEGRMRDEHETRTRTLIDTLATFEKNVESLRTSVLSANRKLKMSEVEQLTEQLTQIGRTAASIKTDFPSLQSKIETRIKQDMERVVRDEKYIREETQAVDQSLRRCKALANIMVTMKKLAMVQDPSLGRGHHAQRNSKNTNVSLTLPPPIPLSSHLPPPPPPPSTEQIPPPPVPPSPNNYSRQETPQTSTLDSVLDEVQSIPSVPHPPAVSSLMHPSIQAVPTGQPPRPPSRTSVSDVRSKFKQPPELPEQIRSLIEDAKRSSPSLDSQANERTPKTLDERQRELAEKQRQLTSQFHQMQSLPQSQSS